MHWGEVVAAGGEGGGEGPLEHHRAGLRAPAVARHPGAGRQAVGGDREQVQRHPLHRERRALSPAEPGPVCAARARKAPPAVP